MESRELTEQEVARAEDEVTRAEAALRDAIAECEGDAAEVAYMLHELRARATEDATIAVGVIESLAGVSAPAVPLERHLVRVLEARADAARARAWVVSAMEDDLKRFRLELADAVAAAESAREELQRRAERPRISPTRRFERIRAVTSEIAARVGPLPEPAPRKHPRVRLETAIDLQSASNFFCGVSENISDGGVFVATDKILDEGSEVELVFTLPGGVEIRGRGVIRWRRALAPGVEPGLGVQFRNLSGAAEDAVQNFLTLRPPLPRP